MPCGVTYVRYKPALLGQSHMWDVWYKTQKIQLLFQQTFLKLFPQKTLPLRYIQVNLPSPSRAKLPAACLSFFAPPLPSKDSPEKNFPGRTEKRSQIYQRSLPFCLGQAQRSAQGPRPGSLHPGAGCGCLGAAMVPSPGKNFEEQGLPGFRCWVTGPGVVLAAIAATALGVLRTGQGSSVGAGERRA